MGLRLLTGLRRVTVRGRPGVRMRRTAADAGMVTAELAACLPVLALILAVALGAESIVGARVRAQDAANEAARALGRGDPAAAAQFLAQTAPRGASMSSSASGGEVTVTVRVTLRPLGGWLGSYSVIERATAADESVVPVGGSP